MRRKGAEPPAPIGFAAKVAGIRALWKWFDFDELFFGFFCGAALTNFGWFMWTSTHAAH